MLKRMAAIFFQFEHEQHSQLFNTPKSLEGFPFDVNEKFNNKEPKRILEAYKKKHNE